jgi:hypothetical protein
VSTAGKPAGTWCLRQITDAATPPHGLPFQGLPPGEKRITVVLNLG